MTDVFTGAAGEARPFLLAAAAEAAHELGIFAALAAAPLTPSELAGRLALDARRLRPLLDVLVLEGALSRDDGGPGEARFAVARAPERQALPREGWGLLADALRSGRPLPSPDIARFHTHLVDAGAAPARDLAKFLTGMNIHSAFGRSAGRAGHLLDAGGGAGAYVGAWLAADPGARATLADRAHVIEMARARLGDCGGRLAFLAGDLLSAPLAPVHDVALLCNVLHLHPPEVCAALVARCAAAVVPGGLVVVKDLRLDEDRRGPASGLLFALNMALYTDGGDVYPVSRITAWLEAAGLVFDRVATLDSAPDAVVVIARRPDLPLAFADRLARTAESTWRELEQAGSLLPGATRPALALPRCFARVLAAAVSLEDQPGAGEATGPGAEAFLRHYLDYMPRMRVEQLATRAEPNQTLFHARLDWARLPRLSAAIDRLFTLCASAGVPAREALGAGDADDFRASRPTLGSILERAHYGGFMPLLYGYPDDLAYFGRALAGGASAHEVIDRYLTAPVTHELAHFAPERIALYPPYLDECVAGYLGVHVLPELAFPAPGEDNGLHAAPWFAQVGQAVVRVAGLDAVVRAHAGVATWEEALPAGLTAAAARLGWADHKARRPLHLLTDNFHPEPWLKLIFLAPSRLLDSITLAELDALPWSEIPAGPESPFDTTILTDALRSMCLRTYRNERSFRVSSRVPNRWISLDFYECRVTVRASGDSEDPAPPAYLFPPAVAARLRGQGHARRRLQLRELDAIPSAVAAVLAGVVHEERGFTLAAGNAAAPGGVE